VTESCAPFRFAVSAEYANGSVRKEPTPADLAAFLASGCDDLWLFGHARVCQSALGIAVRHDGLLVQVFDFEQLRRAGQIMLGLLFEDAFGCLYALQV